MRPKPSVSVPDGVAPRLEGTLAVSWPRETISVQRAAIMRLTHCLRSLLERVRGTGAKAKARRPSWLQRAARFAPAAERYEDRSLLAAINVAVIGTGLGGNPDSGFNAIVSQLNDSTRFDFNASLVAPVDADTLVELSAYDVVVIGDDGNASVPFGTFEAALRSFVEGGGGVVGAGWLIYGAGNYTPPANTDIDAVIPVNTIDFDNEDLGVDVTPNATVHPVTAGVGTFTPGGYVSTPKNTTQPKVDAGATILGTSLSTTTAANEPSIVVGSVVDGRSVYLGAVYAANTAIYSDAGLRTGDGDRLLEQAVAWAAPIDAVTVDDDFAAFNLGDDPDGAGPLMALGFDAFTSIQDAINHVEFGGTVSINPGTYPEELSILKDVSLIGTSGDAADVVINPAANDGITLDNGANVTLESLSINAADEGIYGLSVGDLVVRNVISNGTGADGLRLNIVNSLTIDGGKYSGLTVQPSPSVTIENNKVSVTGNVNVQVYEHLAINADLAATGTITLFVNIDNVITGPLGDNFDQSPTATISTTDASASAINIVVNDLLGGTADALIGSIVAGTGNPDSTIRVDAGSGGIVDNNGAATNLTGNKAVLIGAEGIGVADTLETKLTHLEAAGAAGVRISNEGTLIIGDVGGMTGVSAMTGSINIETHSPLTVLEDITAGGGSINLTATESAGGTDNVHVSNGATLAASADIEICAGDDVYLDFGTFLTAGGTITIEGDCNDADPFGATVSINGLIESLINSVTFTTGDDNDQFYVTSVGPSDLSINAGAGDDDYEFFYPDLSTFTGKATVTDTSGTDDVIVNGTSNPEEFYVITASAPPVLVSRGAPGSELIELSDIETLRVNAMEGADTVHAQPSNSVAITLDGGDPCFDDFDDGDPVDVLDVDAMGAEVSIDLLGPTMNFGPHANGPFLPLGFVNFEEVNLMPLGGGGVQQFDFNNPNTASSVDPSPTQAGYTGVLPTTLYADGLGYGWQAAVTSFERDENFYVNDFADLIRDGHYFGSTSTFTVDVPNPGYYSVSLVFGSPYSDINGFSIANGDSGTVLATGLSTLAGFSENRDFVVYVPDTTLDINFVNSSVTPKIFAVNGMTVRPAVILTMGICPDPLPADGVTTDSFLLEEAPANTLITVRVTDGTILNADADDELEGIQIVTNGAGQADILIRRPFDPVTSVVTFMAVDGTANGASSINYFLPEARNFDFNHFNAASGRGESPTQTPVINALNPLGFIGVLPTRLATGTASFGWLSSPGSFDIGDLRNSQGEIVPDPDPLGALRRDGAFANTDGTFRVELPQGSYKAIITLGYDRDLDGIEITLNGVVVASGISVPAGERRQIPVNFDVTTGLADFGFSDAGGTAPNWAVNGIEIASLFSLSSLDLVSPIGTVPADGFTIVTVHGISGLAEGDQLTVSTSLGTIVTPDANPTIAGIQIAATTGGDFSFDIKAPNEIGTPTIQVTSVDNLGEGTFTDASYLTFNLAETRRFDFNHTQKNGGFGPSPTTALFTGVLRTDTNAAGVGYGWLTSPNSADIGVPNEYDQGGSNLYGKLFTDLYRDYASGHTSLGSRTFQIQVETGTQYSVRVYSGAQDKDQAVTVTVEGVALPQSLSTLAKEFGTLDFADAHDANNDGLLNITFASAGGISPFWVANGVDIAKEPTALPLEAPIVTVQQGLRPGVDPITNEDLGPFIALALNSWFDQGLTPEQIDVLVSAQIIIQQLDNESGLLGYVDGLGRIVLDDDAAGWGWDTLIDSTEGDRIDLESVIAHEMGHLLGFEDLDPHVFGGDLMSAILGLGDRHNSLNGSPFFTSGDSEEEGPPEE